VVTVTRVGDAESLDIEIAAEPKDASHDASSTEAPAKGLS